MSSTLYRELVDPAVERGDLFPADGTYDPHEPVEHHRRHRALHHADQLDGGPARRLAGGGAHRTGARRLRRAAVRPRDRRRRPDQPRPVVDHRHGVSPSRPPTRPVRYIIDWDDTGWTEPDGRPVGDYWTVVRGVRGAALRVDLRGAAERPGTASATSASAAGRSPPAASSPSTWSCRRTASIGRGRRGRERRRRRGAGGARRAPPTERCCRGSSCRGAGRADAERSRGRAPGPEPSPPPDARGGPTEPVYDAEVAADIQGNIIPGFNKDHQQFLFLRFGDADGARDWLRWLAPRLTTMDEVLEFRREFRALRLRLGVREPRTAAPPGLRSRSRTAGIAALAGEDDADAFGEQSFRQGLAERSTYLGDPTRSRPSRAPRQLGRRRPGRRGRRPGDRRRRRAGRPRRRGRRDRRGRRRARPRRGRSSSAATRCPGNLAGHEHFGFKDGISQPGVRGRRVDRAGRPPHAALPATPSDPHAALFAKPGQPLVWPGQFLLGEPRQDPRTRYDPGRPRPRTSRPGRGAARTWCAAGCARTSSAFWEFATTAARSDAGTSPVALASMLVGRWPSGAPLLRSPAADDAALAGDEFANNHFLFDDDTRASVRGDHPRLPRRRAPAAPADLFGRVCPHAAHIRKVNPRDSGTDFGAPADTLLRLMLRRGIPYGEPIAGVADPSPELGAAERGLLFARVHGLDRGPVRVRHPPLGQLACTAQPRRARPDHRPARPPRRPRAHRRRTVRRRRLDDDRSCRRDLVVPTGGGYFFAPPISAVAGVLGAEA